MVESNYPEVVTAVTAVLNQFSAQAAKYPNQPLFVNLKQYPIVQNQTIGNKELDGIATAMSLNDVYLSAKQTKMDLSIIPKQIEPGVMSDESVKLVKFDLARRNTSIPSNGLDLLKEFFFGIYGRRSEVVVTNIYHPESIVMNILTGAPLVPIWNRAKSDMISQRLTTYPIAAQLNVAAFRTYMNRFDSTMALNDFYIKSQKYRINLNSMRVDFEEGGIWDRNSRTFGTWSPFPKDGDYLYGINLAGMILGMLDNQLTGTDRTKFKSGNWENKITYLCISATMNAYTYSYILDYIKPA